MTGVGKIFKVELRCDAVSRLVTPIVAEVIGSPDATIMVQAGGRRGMTVNIQLPAGLEAKRKLVATALESYLFDCTVTTTPA